MSGQDRTRTCDLFCVRDFTWLSIMSTAYIWGHYVYPITTYGGLNVHNVHYFNVVLLTLHTVAHDMKKETQYKDLSKVGKVKDVSPK